MPVPRFAFTFWRTTFTIPVALAAVACLPGGASAANNCQGAPGTSAVEQYCEAIPQADGGRQVPPKRVPKNAQGAVKSSVPVPADLRRAGEDGLAVARFAATAPTVDRSARPPSRTTPNADRASVEPASQPGGAGAPAQAAAVPNGTAFSGAGHALTAGPAAGPELAWSLLALSGVAAGSALLARRRHGPLSGLDPDLGDRS